MIKLFTTIQTLDGKKLEIHEINLGVISSANFMFATQRYEQKYDLFFFILLRILKIDSQQITSEQLENLCIDDYMKINEVIEVFTSKLNLQ